MRVAVKDFLDEKRAQVKLGALSPLTVKTYEEVLDLFERSIPTPSLEQISRPLVQTFLVEAREGSLKTGAGRPTSSAYSVKLWTQLVSFLTWCRRRDYPVSETLFEWDGLRDRFVIPKPYLEEQDHELYIWQADELELIRAAAKANGPRAELVVELLLGTGMRPGELLRLELDDIKGQDILIRSSKSRRGRTKPTRFVPLPTRLRVQLDRYLKRDRPASLSSRLLVQDNGQPYSKWGLRAMLDRVHDKAGVKGGAYHYRHTYATEFLRRNQGKLTKLRDNLGHVDYATLHRYAVLSRADLSAEVDEEDPFG